MAASKYHNVKKNGYDSGREARRAQELRLLEKGGEIRDLREQVAFELIPAIYTDGRALAPIPTQQPDRPSPLGPVPGRPMNARERRAGGLWCLERACSYVADFVYTTRDGKLVVEDAKGFRTEAYKLKKKLMLWRYGIDIKEV